MRWSDKKWYLLLLTIIVIYAFHVCYNEGMMFQGLCSRGARLLLATHFCLSAWNTLLPFCTKHSHSQNMATNVSNWSLKIKIKKTRRHKILFGVHWTGKTGLPKMRHAPLDTNLTVSSPMGLYCNNHIIYLPPNPTSWKLFVQCKLVTSVKDKSGHKIIIWKSTDAPVARNLWTVGWQVLHYAAAEKVQHTLVWKQKKKSYMHGYGTCMWQSRPTFEG